MPQWRACPESARPRTRIIASAALCDHGESVSLLVALSKLSPYYYGRGGELPRCVFRHTLSDHAHHPRTGFPRMILIMISNHTRDLSCKSLITIMISQRFY